jgi:hypothetical protein
MAKTIAEGFRLLRSNLEITGLQEQAVATRQANVRKALENDFNILDSFLTGSYRRQTMIAPLKSADVDIFIVLDPSHYQLNGKKKLLENVRDALLVTYPLTPQIRPDGHAVTITFTDFKVDVVPGFHRKGGGFLIPDTERSEWISTDPKRHVDIWSEANKAHNGDLVPLIKMVKGWNKSRNLFKSFHLETLTLAALQGVTISSFPSGLRFVFDKGISIVAHKLADPAGYSDDVAAHVNTGEKIKALQDRLKWARDTAMDAERLEASGNTRAAFEKWQKLLPDYFPGYD